MLTITEIAGFAGAGLAGAAYVPQISRLVRARCSAGISRLAFEVWLLASLLTTARAVAIHAGVFIVLGGIQIVATALIMLYATRYKDTPCRSVHLPPAQRQDGHEDGQFSCAPVRLGGGQLDSDPQAPPQARSLIPTAHTTHCRPLRPV